VNVQLKVCGRAGHYLSSDGWNNRLGVVRLTFDSSGTRRIARFDLTMGPQIHGFTFNIGDSATNNGYGGDGGTTSNSAEIHSNDNRFYVSGKGKRKRSFASSECIPVRFGPIPRSVVIHCY
jgi:hypothetical protein